MGQGLGPRPCRTVRHSSEVRPATFWAPLPVQVAQREHQLAQERERQAAGRVRAAQAGDAAARQQSDQLRRDARALGSGPIRDLEHWLALPQVRSPRAEIFWQSMNGFYYRIMSGPYKLRLRGVRS